MKANQKLKTLYTIAVIVLVMGAGACNSEQKTSGENESTTEAVAETPKPHVDIHSAALMGDVQSIQQHIAYGSDLNAKDAYGSTPLVVATVFDKREVVRVLLEGGADINATNAEGSTPLHVASFLCREEIVEMLLDHNADRSIRNQYGSTALESVKVPFTHVEAAYVQFSKGLEALGLKLDFDRIEQTRPVIAEMLQK
jgi:hypothetical protein